MKAQPKPQQAQQAQKEEEPQKKAEVKKEGEKKKVEAKTPQAGSQVKQPVAVTPVAKKAEPVANEQPKPEPAAPPAFNPAVTRPSAKPQQLPEAAGKLQGPFALSPAPANKPVTTGGVAMPTSLPAEGRQLEYSSQAFSTQTGGGMVNSVAQQPQESPFVLPKNPMMPGNDLSEMLTPKPSQFPGFFLGAVGDSKPKSSIHEPTMVNDSSQVADLQRKNPKPIGSVSLNWNFCC